MKQSKMLKKESFNLKKQVMSQKNSIQNFKLPEDIKKEFNELCELNFTTASHELRKFVYQKIQEFTNDLRRRHE